MQLPGHVRYCCYTHTPPSLAHVFDLYDLYDLQAVLSGKLVNSAPSISWCTLGGQPRVGRRILCRVCSAIHAMMSTSVQETLLSAFPH